MKIHSLNHADFENPGYFQTWAEKHGHSMTITHTHKGDILPSTNDYDFLLIMGGPQTALQLEKFPYLRDEIAHIQSAIAKNKYVLGVCLGAQLIGEALGAKTLHSPEREVGIFPVQLTEAGKKHAIFYHFSEQFPVTHWHNDMPWLPKGAKLLAKSEGCPHQIVEFNAKTYGFQCHFELARDNIVELVEHCAVSLKPGKYIQMPAAMLEYDYSTIHRYLEVFLNHFITSSL